MVFKKRTNNRSDGNISSQPGAVKAAKNKRSKRKTLLIVASVIVMILLLVVAAWIIGDPADDRKLTNEQEYAKNFIQSDNSEETQARLVDQYAAKYDEASANVYKTSPDSWDKSALDDAYVALLYADKMQSYTQVGFYLSSIEAAQASGLNIDENSYGINQEVRDAIKQRYNDWSSKNDKIDNKVKEQFEKVL